MKTITANSYLTYKGETLQVNQWAERINKSTSTIIRRYRSGRPIDDVLQSANLNKNKTGQQALHDEAFKGMSESQLATLAELNGMKNAKDLIKAVYSGEFT